MIKISQHFIYEQLMINKQNRDLRRTETLQSKTIKAQFDIQAHLLMSNFLNKILKINQFV